MSNMEKSCSRIFLATDEEWYRHQDEESSGKQKAHLVQRWAFCLSRFYFSKEPHREG